MQPWFGEPFNPLLDMQTPPDTSAPVICVRNPWIINSKGKAIKEQRPPAIDWWGPDKKWRSPRLGRGSYLGYYKIPSVGWKSAPHKPAIDSPVLCYVCELKPGSWREISRGYYLGKCSFEGERRQWRIQIDWLKLPAEDREWLRRCSDALMWIPLPEGVSNNAQTVALA